ncbi:MAG TPA: hypothetical protein VF622_00915 [Segetibacter sp.]|jgi:hypothetical protein
MDQLLTALIAIASIILGWSLNLFTNWFDKRSSDNVKRKKVIFSLLEILNLFDTLNIKLLIENIKDKVFKLFPPEMGLEDNQDVTHTLMTLLQPLVKQLVNERLLQIDKIFNNSVHDLSSVDPIIAYRMFGLTNRVQSLDYITDKIQSQFAGVQGIELIQDKLNQLAKTEYHEHAISEITTQVEEFIIILSKKVSRKLHSEASKTIRKIKTATPPQISAATENLISEVAKKISEEYKIT